MASSEFPTDYDQMIEQTIATCGGDLRGAVRALLIANEHLEAELSQLKYATKAMASFDFVRRGYLN